jgi:hypothetical protein
LSTNFWHAQWDNLYLSSLLFINFHGCEPSEDKCEYHSSAQGHSLKSCEDFKKEVTSLAARGIIRRKTTESAKDCMMINQLRFTSHENIEFPSPYGKEKRGF